ncbi:MAG: septum formation initiator family protein [Desulfobacterales bacterium]|jgi:cell division protein FtsB|nr:septum formation initiator family protein [Desulfobacteraceae bacterium]MBT4364020.1 septum formation initiator family protein [Desulfobacteraceae bacterium]MBT7086932.1 septum formation initiator family protein [Desulfobacterales bacterium]MBT7696067.1 septum formation initiator family protein [Desulfobacterales bacterium]
MSMVQKIIFALISILLFAMLIIIIFSEKGFIDLNEMKKKRDSLLSENAKINNENLVLYRKIKRTKDDPKYIEDIARQELGMIRKNEVILKIRKNGESANE